MPGNPASRRPSRSCARGRSIPSRGRSRRPRGRRRSCCSRRPWSRTGRARRPTAAAPASSRRNLPSATSPRVDERHASALQGTDLEAAVAVAAADLLRAPGESRAMPRARCAFIESRLSSTASSRAPAISGSSSRIRLARLIHPLRDGLWSWTEWPWASWIATSAAGVVAAPRRTRRRRARGSGSVSSPARSRAPRRREGRDRHRLRSPSRSASARSSYAALQSLSASRRLTPPPRRVSIRSRSPGHRQDTAEISTGSLIPFSSSARVFFTG